MIEFQSTGLLKGDWRKWPWQSSLESNDFDIGQLIFRIDGIIYEEWTEELEKALLWEKLQRLR